MQRASQRKPLEVGRGLFLIRYSTADDIVQPPRIEVSPDPASQKSVQLILHPDHDAPILWQPGACLIVHSLAPGKLWIEASAPQGGSTVASVSVEHLTAGKPVPEPKSAASANPLDVGDFQILGHVAGIGDVVVNANQWLAGPASPSRIEGISLTWPGKPRNLEVQYAIRTVNSRALSQMMKVGSFAGTRGRALPLVGAVFELSGPRASTCQFSVEANFLGSPTMRVTGTRVVISGPTGREPLVGLRIGVEDLAAREAAPPVPEKPEAPKRVRVFRSRPKQEKTVSF